MMLPLNTFALAAFLDGGRGYNLTALLLGVAGLLVSVVGFGVAIWQLVRTRRAAEAAREAVTKATRRLHLLTAVADTSELSARIEMAAMSVQQHDLSIAAFLCRSIRSTLIDLRDRQGHLGFKFLLQSPEILHEIRAILRLLDEPDRMKADESLRRATIRRIRSLEELLEQIRARARSEAEVTGVADEHSQ